MAQQTTSMQLPPCTRSLRQGALTAGAPAVALPCPRFFAPWPQDMVAEGVIEKFIGLDMSDAETVFDRCLEAIKRVKKVGAGGPACRRSVHT